MCGICICWSIDVYMSYVLCFQSGGGTAKSQEEKGLVETDCLQVHGAGKVAVVSKALSIFFFY